MTDFLQLLVQGLALGAAYALVALGFVVIYKATAVINFAHGELMLLGAYLVYGLHVEAGLPFLLAVPLAMALMALVGWAVERALLRRMVGRPTFSVVMITIGLAIVLRQVITVRFGFDERLLGDPWGSSALALGGVQFNVVSVWSRWPRAARSSPSSSRSSAARGPGSRCARRRSTTRRRSPSGSRCAACTRGRG